MRRALLNEGLPVEKRVRILEELTKSTNPFAKLKALERIDELSGIITERSTEGEQINRQIFVFQGGMNIDFGGASANQAGQVDDIQNITPEHSADSTDTD